ncbi:hypothetical protein BTA51_24470 [Hahella sp. CCB-MM4]|uniref:LIC_13387 family protein n=1 Tax=Hahella sp. (strain CCB-MM4) TaxID=1926491 RepID=UPI000B9A5721|nr:hypothetical protein [Hahella sp. CCB-MM4]OZG70743.1 hypothetical protein BTA51_24470 [Hahella sp. CCB-MM4]
MIAKILMIASAGVILLLGAIHLLYTFFGSKFDPRDNALKAGMEQVAPVITRQTTMWRAWIGFNASHSMGGILFGLIYGYLSLYYDTLLFQSSFLLATGLAMLIGLLALAKRYWFRIPFTGISISLALYIAGIIIALA